ncbi:MAG: hypothetical protein IAE90_06855 [Ignavibacteria bacterium]|nr:hypothetical protein [Ignavibacteria bacterium]
MEHKIFKLLSELSKSEFNRFGDFIVSPYFNRLQKVTLLYNEIRKFHPSFSSRWLSSEKLYGRIFPGLKYNDMKMRVLYSQMFSLAEKFLAAEKYFADETTPQLDITAEHRKRGNHRMLESSLNRLESALPAQTKKDSAYYENLSRFLFEKNHLGSQFAGNRDFVLEADTITIAHIIKTLWIYSTIYNIKGSLNIEIDETVINAVERLAQLPGFSNIPAVKLNYLLYHCVRYMDEESFFGYIEVMNKYPDVCSTADLYQAHVILLNFCVLKIRAGKTEFRKTKFELYRNMISKELWSYERYIPYAIFNNIITSAIENRQQEFGFEFLKQYTSKLEPGYIDSISNFCYAKLYYSLGELDAALGYLAKTGTSDDIFYKFAVKDLNIKIFYETGRDEQVYSLIDTYKHMISRSKLLSPEVKASYRMFLKFLTDLLRPGGDSGVLQNSLKAAPGFVNKEWLMNMAEKLVS